jgi:catechol 2,3-dioxygenase-like lactoylglutathione lyase family enzyme
MVGANSVEESRNFYDSVLATLGYRPGALDDKGRCFYVNKIGVFAITKPINGEQSSVGNGSTIGFIAKDIISVDAWHETGLANGGSVCEQPPGIRENAFGALYAAYLRDPAGNKICAIHHIKE